MIHRICDRCLKVESVDFGEMIDDAFYCTECYEEMEKEMQKEDESNADKAIKIIDDDNPMYAGAYLVDDD